MKRQRAIKLSFALVICALAASGCGNSPTSAGIEPEILNEADSFEYQVSEIQEYSGIATYVWMNSGTAANFKVVRRFQRVAGHRARQRADRHRRPRVLSCRDSMRARCLPSRSRDLGSVPKACALVPGSSSLRRVVRLAVVLFVVLGPTASRVNAELSTSFQQTGNLGVEIAGVGGGNVLITGGTLTLNHLPATASIVKATLYASQVENPDAQDARFAGVILGSVGPYASDADILNYFTYTWDVTSLVTPGTNAYSFRVGGNVNGGLVAGVALVVVWHDWSEPTRIITINDGMQQIRAGGPNPESTTFDNLGAGNTEVWLFTVLDDNVNTGEVVEYNDISIGGPLDQNLGPLASVLQLDANSVSGGNTLRVTTVTDHMGWMIAASAVTIPAVPVTPTTWQHVKELYR